MYFKSLDRVEREAGRLLERARVVEAPVNVEDLALRLGLEVRYERNFRSDLSGVLVKQAAKSTIGINASHPKTRQRFSIAHEIGHFWLGHAGDMFVDEAKGRASIVFRDGRSSEGTEVPEMEANRFAAAVLMPASLLIVSLKRVVNAGTALSEKEVVAQLAREYQVSPQAMRIRLTSLGLMVVE